MLYTKATKEEIANASNTDLIICFMALSWGNVYKYKLKTTRHIAEELERRGIVVADDLVEDFKNRITTS